MIQDLRQPCSLPVLPEKTSGQQPRPMQEQFSLHADDEGTVLATQSAFPSCISLNKVELSLISSGLGFYLLFSPGLGFLNSGHFKSTIKSLKMQR